MDGNQMEHLTYFVKIVKIRPLMDGNNSEELKEISTYKKLKSDH